MDPFDLVQDPAFGSQLQGPSGDSMEQWMQLCGPSPSISSHPDLDLPSTPAPSSGHSEFLNDKFSSALDLDVYHQHGDQQWFDDDFNPLPMLNSHWEPPTPSPTLGNLSPPVQQETIDEQNPSLLIQKEVGDEYHLTPSSLLGKCSDEHYSLPQNGTVYHQSLSFQQGTSTEIQPYTLVSDWDIQCQSVLPCDQELGNENQPSSLQQHQSTAGHPEFLRILEMTHSEWDQFQDTLHNGSFVDYVGKTDQSPQTPEMSWIEDTLEDMTMGIQASKRSPFAQANPQSFESSMILGCQYLQGDYTSEEVHDLLSMSIQRPVQYHTSEMPALPPGYIQQPKAKQRRLRIKAPAQAAPALTPIPDAGNLRIFPSQILNIIIENLTLTSFEAFSKTNKFFKATCEAHPYRQFIRCVMERYKDTYRALSKLESYFTIHILDVMFEKNCVKCGQPAFMVYLPMMRRACEKCLKMDRFFETIVKTSAQIKYRLNHRTACRLPQVKCTSEYGFSRIAYVCSDYMAKKAGIEFHGSEEVMAKAVKIWDNERMESYTKSIAAWKLKNPTLAGKCKGKKTVEEQSKTKSPEGLNDSDLEDRKKKSSVIECSGDADAPHEIEEMEGCAPVDGSNGTGKTGNAEKPVRGSRRPREPTISTTICTQKNMFYRTNSCIHIPIVDRHTGNLISVSR